MISYLLSFMLLISAGCVPESSSFAGSYIKNIQRNYCKFHRQATRRSYGAINKTDSILFIQLLTINKEIAGVWDYGLPANNERFASWECLDFKREHIDELLLYRNGKYERHFDHCRIKRRGLFWRRRFLETNNVVYKQLLELASLYKPDGIFTVYEIPGWFFIIGDTIIFFKLQNQQLILYEDSLDYLKKAFTSRYFLPVFTGEEIFP